jgi:hypothetical protein
MILSILAFVCYASEGAIAFAPSSLIRAPARANNLQSNSAKLGRKHQDFSLFNERLLVEPIDPREDVDVLGDDKLISEELLESITNTKPEDVLAVVDVDVSEQVTAIFADSQQGVQNSKSNTNSNVLPGVEFAAFSNATLSEDVKAVLEASGEAAAAAEASMPQELIEQLNLSSVGSNATVVDAIPEILSAASVVGEPVTATKIEAPRVSQILKFAIPAIGVWLCGPLLSLIDTSAVGLLSGTIQQAALNPAVAVTDYAALLIVSNY